ncbi:MAG: YtxH domain-containing protein [Candidatus Acidiferrales bacterium]
MKFTSFITGLGVGAAVAMLFAPKSGDEMREFLSESAEDGRRYAKERGRELRAAANDVVDRGREVVSRQKDAVTAAAHAAKDTYNRESQTGTS